MFLASTHGLYVYIFYSFKLLSPLGFIKNINFSKKTKKSQKSLEYDKILTELSVFAKTEQSRALCLDLTPYVRHEDIEREIAYTSEAKKILDNAKDIPIEKIQNFSKLKEKLEDSALKGVLCIGLLALCMIWMSDATFNAFIYFKF